MRSDVPTPSATAELAGFLAAVHVDDRLRSRAVDFLLDTVGAIVYGAELPWARSAAVHALATGGDGRSTVVGAPAEDEPMATTPAMAAFANGAAAHAFELDDVHEEAISHPGAVVVPAALAVAEDLEASERDLLDAIVVGYEAMGRAGIAVGPASHMLGGFHPTSMSGVFGAAAAAGRLLGFDADRLNHALGIAASFASGTMEFAASGGMAKRVHAARAAEGGVTAALLAAGGLDGADDALAGRYGFCRIFTDEPRIGLLTEDLGERWMCDEITVKPWAACSDLHPMIQAAIELRDELDLEGPAADVVDRIDHIEVTGPTKAATQNSLDGTASVMAAQYSAQFNVAAAILADPADPATYSEAGIAAPELAELQAKVVSVEAAPEFDATYAWKMGGAVRIVLADGTTGARAVHGQKGSMHDPLTAAELDAKFTTLTGGRTDPGLRSAIRSVADRPISALSGAIAGTPR